MTTVDRVDAERDESVTAGDPDADLDGVMVFDGTCRLCAKSVRAVLRMDRSGVVTFVSAQSPYGRILCAWAGVDPDDPSTFLFFAHGRPLAASDAVVAILRRMPWPWRWLRFIALVPRPIRDRVYGVVARNRYTWFGRETCPVYGPEVRARLREHGPHPFA